MLFQVIDNKSLCKSVYADKKIIKNPSYNIFTKTWEYHPVLKDHNIEYAFLYSNGSTLQECCPDYLKTKWNKIKEKHLAYIRSFQLGKVKASDYCFYDLVPQNFLIEYFEIKSQITNFVLENFTKPKNYDFLVDLNKLISEISLQTLNIDKDCLAQEMHQYKTRKFIEKLSILNQHVCYNIFGTITGRLTTKKESFPILTLDKSYRKILKPTNDWFIELDFNGAELRCLLALNKEDQPEKDIHDWHSTILNKLFDYKMSRDEIKRKIFGWLYGGGSISLGIPEIEKYYNKQKVIKKYWDGTQVINPFGRTIKADEFHALNAIIQSTSSDVFLRRAIAVNKLLEGRKSFTMGLIHDSMVIDFDRNDKDILESLITEFGNTDLGIFKVNASLGITFGNMRKFK